MAYDQERSCARCQTTKPQSVGGASVTVIMRIRSTGRAYRGQLQFQMHGATSVGVVALFQAQHVPVAPDLFRQQLGGARRGELADLCDFQAAEDQPVRHPLTAPKKR